MHTVDVENIRTLYNSIDMDYVFLPVKFKGAFSISVLRNRPTTFRKLEREIEMLVKIGKP